MAHELADELKAALARHAAEMGRRGGKARLTKMTAEQRHRVAKRAAEARWAKKAIAPDPTPTPPNPGGPHRDQQWAEAGIMSTPRRRKPAVPVSVNPDLEGLRNAV